MYRPLQRFLEQFGYDPAAPLNPILLSSILNRHLPEPIQPCVNQPDMFERNCSLLAAFFNTNSVDVLELAELTFNFVARRSNSPDTTIVKVLKNYEFDVSDYKRLLLNGVLFNLIIHSFRGTFNADFDILLRTYIRPQTRQQTQSNLRIGLHFINKLGCALVQSDDFEDSRVLPFVLYQLGQIEHLLKGFVQLQHEHFEFADAREDMTGSVEAVSSEEKNCVFITNLVSWRGTLRVLFNLVFSSDSTCIEIGKDEIIEVEKQGNSIILLAKSRFSKTDSAVVKLGFLSDDECAANAQSIVEWLEQNTIED